MSTSGNQEDTTIKYYRINIPVSALKPGMVFKGLLFDDNEKKIAEGKVALSEKLLNEIKEKNIANVHYYTQQLDTSLPVPQAQVTEEQSAISNETMQKTLNKVKEIEDAVKKEEKIYTEDIATVATDIYKDLKKNKTALIGLMKLKNIGEFLYTHAVNVGALAVMLADYMQFPEDTIINLGIAGLIHDIGFVRIPPEVFLKEGKPTKEQWDIIKTHPKIGHDLLGADINSPPVALNAILYHHERYDGSGYPRGYASSSIDISAQILAVVDVYDAMTNDRPYRKGFEKKDALLYIFENAGKLFSTKVVESFIKCIAPRINLDGLFSIGSYVVLSSGEIGKVISENHDNLTKPVVAIVLDTTKKYVRRPVEINLLYDKSRRVAQTITDSKVIAALEKGQKGS